MVENSSLSFELFTILSNFPFHNHYMNGSNVEDMCVTGAGADRTRFPVFRDKSIVISDT
jgi:hypothetical protein